MFLHCQIRGGGFGGLQPHFSFFTKRRSFFTILGLQPSFTDIMVDKNSPERLNLHPLSKTSRSAYVLKESLERIYKILLDNVLIMYLEPYKRHEVSIFGNVPVTFSKIF